MRLGEIWGSGFRVLQKPVAKKKCSGQLKVIGLIGGREYLCYEGYELLAIGLLLEVLSAAVCTFLRLMRLRVIRVIGVMRFLLLRRVIRVGLSQASNIRVAVRCRPFNARERAEAEREVHHNCLARPPAPKPKAPCCKP